MICDLQRRGLLHDDFVYIDEYVRGIRWDAKYATWDNFTGRPVDGYRANRIVGTRALCTALAHAQHRAEASGCGLLLWDGYRPQRAVESFLRWAMQPEDGLTKPRHYPNIDRLDMVEQGYVAARSAHSRGSAIDLTLYDLATDELLPMGGDHDLMDPISHHRAPHLTAGETANRTLLRSIMAVCGFDGYEREWWHYTLRDEPHPHDCFDFPIA